MVKVDVPFRHLQTQIEGHPLAANATPVQMTSAIKVKNGLFLFIIIIMVWMENVATTILLFLRWSLFSPVCLSTLARQQTFFAPEKREKSFFSLFHQEGSFRVKKVKEEEAKRPFFQLQLLLVGLDYLLHSGGPFRSHLIKVELISGFCRHEGLLSHD